MRIQSVFVDRMSDRVEKSAGNRAHRRTGWFPHLALVGIPSGRAAAQAATLGATPSRLPAVLHPVCPAPAPSASRPPPSPSYGPWGKSYWICPNSRSTPPLFSFPTTPSSVRTPPPSCGQLSDPQTGSPTRLCLPPKSLVLPRMTFSMSLHYLKSPREPH